MRAGKPCKLLAAFLDGGERRGPVDMRLTHSKQVEVRPVQDHRSHGGPFVERVPARVSRRVRVSPQTSWPARSPVSREYRLLMRETPHDYAAVSPAIMRTL